MSDEYLDLWGEKMEVHHFSAIRVGKNEFPVCEVTASDDTRAVVRISTERVTKDVSDVQSLIQKTLETRGLHPTFLQNNNHLFLKSVSPLDKEIEHVFGAGNAGVIALVNGREPGHGSHALDEMTLHAGDTLDLVYRVGTETYDQ